jgi:putrescine transport system permease protein
VAYYIARYGGRLKVLLLTLMIAPFWMSYLMRMLAWVNLLSVKPEDPGLFNRLLLWTPFFDHPIAWSSGAVSHLTVILGLVYGYIPFFILPLYAALDRIDRSQLEASRDMGASPASTFWRVTLPLSKQGILAGAVIITLPMFGDYYTPNLMTASPENTMMGNAIDLALQGGQGQQPKGAALTLLLSAFIGALMIYYLVSVSRAAKEAQR